MLNKPMKKQVNQGLVIAHEAQKVMDVPLYKCRPEGTVSSRYSRALEQLDLARLRELEEQFARMVASARCNEQIRIDVELLISIFELDLIAHALRPPRHPDLPREGECA